MTYKSEPDEQGRLYPSYKVEILRVADGEIRIYDDNNGIGWGAGSLFWWTEGNASCDCNRGDFFADAGNEERDENIQCSDGKFKILRFIFPDGTELKMEE